MPTDSIKVQLIKKAVDLIAPLKNAVRPVREIKRTHGLLILNPIKPAVHVCSFDENELSKDNRGRTKKFPLAFKIATDTADEADEIAAEIEEIIEANNTLGDLAVAVDNKSSHPYVNTVDDDTGGIILIWDVTYRTKLGNPRETY